MPYRVLITGGPTYEPIDPVRFLGNRSSGKMGAALAQSALAGGHQVTTIAGPGTVPMPSSARQLSIESSDQLLHALLAEFPGHDLLIMAAAVADYRPRNPSAEKLKRESRLMLELEATPDILATLSRIKRPDQRTIGFSLQTDPDLGIARRKLRDKNLDLIVYNPAETLASSDIEPTLLFPDGTSEKLSCRSKEQFADNLMQRAVQLF